MHQPAAVAGANEGEADAVNEAACQQDHGIDRADRQRGLLRAGVEPGLIPVARIDPARNSAPKNRTSVARNSHMPEIAVSA